MPWRLMCAIGKVRWQRSTVRTPLVDALLDIARGHCLR